MKGSNIKKQKKTKPIKWINQENSKDLITISVEGYSKKITTSNMSGMHTTNNYIYKDGKFYKDVDLMYKSVNEEELINTKLYYPIKDAITDPSLVTRENTPYIKQRSPAWFALRGGLLKGSAETLVTASGLPTDLGMNLKYACDFFGADYNSGKLKEFKDKFEDRKEPNLSFIKYKLTYGTNHENSATMGVLNAFKYNLKNAKFEIHETGSWLKPINSKMDALASPDGIFTLTKEEGTVVKGCVENKCRCPFHWMKDPVDGVKKYRYTEMKPFDPFPYYYIPQVMFQMYATGLKWCAAVSWVYSETAVFLVQYDEDYMKLMLKILSFVYDKYYFGKQKVISKNPFEMPEISETYRSFLKKTKDIVEKSKKIYTVKN